MCHPTDSWVDILPTVLLGLRSAFEEVLQASPADFIYGGQLRLPNEFYEENSQQTDSAECLQKLREHLGFCAQCLLHITPRTKCSNSKTSTHVHMYFYEAMLYENHYNLLTLDLIK